MTVNEQVWKRLYAEGKNDLKYPSDLLVRVGANILPKRSLEVLDFGFGTGANALHFAQSGHKVSGLEISPDALAKTTQRFKENKIEAKLSLYEPGTKLPYPDQSFDAIIAWQVLYYNDWNSLRFISDELYRVLKPGGQMICSLAAPGDVSHQMSTSLGNSLYESKVPGQEGCILVIPTKEEIEKRIFAHKNPQVGFFEFQYLNIHAKHWIITYQKE